MPQGLCKCGGSYRKADVPLPDGYQTALKCTTCGTISYRRPRGSVTKPQPAHKLTSIEIGQGVVNYIAYLENELSNTIEQIKELRPLAEERDKLKGQIEKMQQKYNEAHINGSVDIPKKMF